MLHVLVCISTLVSFENIPSFYPLTSLSVTGVVGVTARMKSWSQANVTSCLRTSRQYPLAPHHDCLIAQGTRIEMRTNILTTNYVDHAAADNERRKHDPSHGHRVDVCTT